MPEPGHIDLGPDDRPYTPPKATELTATDLAERWSDDPPAERPVVRTRYQACDGTTMELVHPQMVPPPSIVMHDGVPAQPIKFHYQSPA
jgi:hypothetical protein